MDCRDCRFKKLCITARAGVESSPPNTLFRSNLKKNGTVCVVETGIYTPEQARKSVEVCAGKKS